MKKLLCRGMHALATWRYIDVTVLLVGIAVYAAQVLSTMSRWSTWFDEAFGAYLVRFSFPDIAHYTALDVHPPLYYWVLKIWTSVFGVSEVGFRSLSMVFGIVTIVFGFLLVKKLFGRRAAWLSLLFLVISPMLIRYGQEARMYTMAAAIGLAATYVLAIAVASKRKLPWIMYGVLIAAGMWTHYFTAMVWLAHWVWRAVVTWHESYRGKKFFAHFFTKEWIGAHVLAIVLFLPWIGQMFNQLFGIQTGWFWIAPVGADTLTNYITTILFFQKHDEVSPQLALLLIIITIVLVMLTGAVYRRSNALQRRNYLLIACMAIVPVILVFIASLPPLRSSFVERYLMPSVVSFSLFVGVIIAAASRKLRPITQGAIILLVASSMIIGVIHAQTIGNFNKDSNIANETKSVIAEIAMKSSGNEPIICRSPWIFYEAAFYETAAHPVYYLKSTVVDAGSGSLAMLQGNDSHNIINLDQFDATHPLVWYIGEPANGTMPTPVQGWKEIQSFRIDDPVTGKQLYQAIEFSTHP